jgi:superfamily II DNA or RNA helicase
MKKDKKIFHPIIGSGIKDTIKLDSKNNDVIKGMIKLSFNAMPKVRTAKQRMNDAMSQPAIKRLLSDIWQTNEIHLLFADTGVGKSIFALALAKKTM